MVEKMSAKILIVDSNTIARDQVEPLLLETGLQTSYSADGLTACAMIRQRRPDLVLLDAGLALNDPSLCQKLRTSAPEVHLPIILLLPQQKKVVSEYLCGTDADDFITRPFHSQELLARVLNRLSQQQRQQVKDLPRVDYQFLAGLSKLATSDLDSTQILQRVVAAIDQVIEVHRCSITMVREDDSYGYVMASSDDPELNGLRIELDKYPEIRETISTGRPLLIDNIYRHPLMEGVRPYIERLGFNSILVLPMIDRQRIIGVLVVRAARSIEGFAEEEISFCQLVANVATSALRFAELNGGPAAIRLGPQSEDGDSQQQLMQRRGALLDMAAHDLRVLVSVIDGYCLLLHETESENLSRQQTEFVDGLMAGCRRLVELTNNLLDFSRIEAGRLELDLQEQDLCQVLTVASHEIRPLMRRRGIDLDIQSRTPSLRVRCDVENVRRVFYNLMSNAVKFTPVGGTIQLQLSEDEQQAFVSVEDSGPGIPSNLLPGLFDEFSHGPSPDGRHGNGLGLSICKKIVDAHCGRIWAESILGQGSRFTFSLPK